MTSKKQTVRVYHLGYGCETGCCGHVVELPDGRTTEFDFMHGAGETRESAIDFAKREVARDFPECVASLDWDKADTSEIRCPDDG